MSNLDCLPPEPAARLTNIPANWRAHKGATQGQACWQCATCIKQRLCAPCARRPTLEEWRTAGRPSTNPPFHAKLTRKRGGRSKREQDQPAGRPACKQACMWHGTEALRHGANPTQRLSPRILRRSTKRLMMSRYKLSAANTYSSTVKECACPLNSPRMSWVS